MKLDCKGHKDHFRISQSAKTLNNKEIFSNMNIAPRELFCQEGSGEGKRGREERHSIKSSKPRDEWESCVKNNANKLIYKTEIESQM